MSIAPTPPRYFWLWHLAALNVIKADFGPSPAELPAASKTSIRAQHAPPITSTLWDQIPTAGKPPATAALIDTGVSRMHPNLANRIDVARSIDLTSHRYGAQNAPILPNTTPASREECRNFFAALSLDGLGALQLASHEMEYLESMVAEYRGASGVVRRMIDPEETFASHGTSCAGLIVGEPAVALPADGENDAPVNPNLLPYFGVDPYSKLLSIRTSFEADPHQFIAALLYAWSCRVDVIIMPRGLPDPIRSRLAPKTDLMADLETWRGRQAADLYARLGTDLAPEIDPTAAQAGHLPDRPWIILKQLVLAISRQIPVVCAAGNDGESQLIYPAYLAADDNGIIAVGAVTPEGFRSGYSNYGDGLTLVAPSDDYEIYNRHQTRLDLIDPLRAMHDYSVGSAREYAFSPLDLVTTDLPGVFGYDAGHAPWSFVLPGQGNLGVGGGYYAAFGGTSGASSLIGGVVLLAQRARKAHGKPSLTGLQAKTLICQASSVSAIVAPGTRPLTPDTMNADDEDQIEPEYFFGAGLLDAASLIEAAISL